MKTDEEHEKELRTACGAFGLTTEDKVLLFEEMLSLHVGIYYSENKFYCGNVGYGDGYFGKGLTPRAALDDYKADMERARVEAEEKKKRIAAWKEKRS